MGRIFVVVCALCRIIEAKIVLTEEAEFALFHSIWPYILITIFWFHQQVFCDVEALFFAIW